jgi:hypothetical protein
MVNGILICIRQFRPSVLLRLALQEGLTDQRHAFTDCFP